MRKKWMMIGVLVALVGAAGCDDSPASPDVTVSEFSSEIEECLKFEARGECESSGCWWDLGVESWELGEALQSSPMCTPATSDCRPDRGGGVASDSSGRCWMIGQSCLLPDWSEESSAAKECADDYHRAKNLRAGMCAELSDGEACQEAECKWFAAGSKLLDSGCKIPVYECLGSLDFLCENIQWWAVTPDGSCAKVNSVCRLEGWQYYNEEAEACRETYETAVCR